MQAALETISELLKELNYPMMYETGGNMEFISDNFYQYTGFFPEELKHNRNFFPTKIHPQDLYETNHALEEWHKEGNPGIYHQTFRFKNSLGDYIWLDDFMVKKSDGDTKFLRGLLIQNDKLRKDEIELMRKKFILEKDNKLTLNTKTTIHNQLDYLKKQHQHQRELVEQLFTILEKHHLQLAELILPTKQN